MFDTLGIEGPLPVPSQSLVTDEIAPFIPDRSELERHPNADLTLDAFEQLFAFLAWVGENAEDADELFVSSPHLIAVSEATGQRLLELAAQYTADRR